MFICHFKNFCYLCIKQESHKIAFKTNFWEAQKKYKREYEKYLTNQKQQLTYWLLPYSFYILF